MNYRAISKLVFIGLLLGFATGVSAQDAAEMARKLQNPLANIKALMTDNGLEFKSGQDDVTSYSFSIQPVYAIPFDKYRFNFILRGVFPIVGLAPGAQKPIVGNPLPPGSNHTWGLGDSQIQMFFSPQTESPLKWGVGPIISMPTRTKSELTGAGWGGGAAFVLVGSFSEAVSFSVVGGHTWGEAKFSTSFVQPMVFFNIPGMEGVALSYNNTISYNHNADSGNNWTVPLGLTISKTFAFPSGHGLDLGLGLYSNVTRPEGAADWVLKWAVTLIFP